MKFAFLISSERSGSNLLTTLMNGHSRVSAPSPTHLFRLFGTNRKNYGDLDDDRNWRVLAEDLVLNFDAKLGVWASTLSTDELMSKASRRSISGLLRLIYEKEARSFGADLVFVKENRTSSFAPFLLAHFPHSHFVVLVRDPRDVASSWLRTDAVPGGVEEAVTAWQRDQTEALALYHQIRDSGRVTLLTYEALIASTAEVLADLCRDLDLYFEPTMLDAYDNRMTQINANRIEGWSNLSKPVLTNNAGQYRTILSAEDVRYVELRCGQLMHSLGYTLDTDLPTSDISVAEEAEQLRSRLSKGAIASFSAVEKRIREERLAAITRVLERRL